VAVPPVLRPLVEILACLEGGCEPVEGARAPAAVADAEDRRLASLAREDEGAAPLEVDRGVAAPAPLGKVGEVAPTPMPLPGAAAADEARYRSDGLRAGGGPIAEASADWKAAPPWNAGGGGDEGAAAGVATECERPCNWARLAADD
jgi:hypothetical protein